MKIDFVVMGHIKREQYFDYLRSHLGYNTSFSIDDDYQKLGTWGNCRRAWSMVDPDADYGCVIQDDAILCKDFVRHATAFIEKHAGYAMNLYFGDRDTSRDIYFDSETRKQGYIEHPRLMWGVAICLPQQHIKPMIQIGDYQTGLPDDTRIRNYCIRAGLKARFPDPGLVDHRDIPSLVDPTKPYRYAINFIDD